MFVVKTCARAVGLFTILFSTAVYATDFQLPAEWQGKTVGKSDNNPVLVDGKPLWNFYQIWPDDPSDGDNYVPMIWTGESWQSNGHDFGGQPAVQINRTTVTLSSRGSWGSDGAMKGGKFAAISFAPPKAGKYTLNGTLTADVWYGEGTVQLVISTLDKKGIVKVVKSIDLPKGASPASMDPVVVDAQDGDQIVLAASVKAMYVAANIKIGRLKIESE